MAMETGLAAPADPDRAGGRRRGLRPAGRPPGRRSPARRNPGVATFEAIALGLRGLLDANIGPLARAAGLAPDSPRPLVRAAVFEDYGRALLRAGDVAAGAVRLDQAWAIYDDVGAHEARAEVQRALRASGVRRS